MIDDCQKETYNVFIWGSSMEPYNASFRAITILLNCIGGGFRLVNKVWIEDVKLVTLHDLWRWIIMIIVSLVVLVPLISSVNTVEIFRLPRPVLVMPPVNLQRHSSV